MRRFEFVILAMALLPCCTFGVDGVVLINQSTVVSAGGFPYKITQSGSYRLSGNLTVSATNTTAISITVDNVTIDLNGFSIIGPTVCTGHPVTGCTPTNLNSFGIDGGSYSNITLLNGVVRGMWIGVRLWGDGSYVERVSAFSNLQYGFYNTGGGCAITHSTANDNGNIGIQSQACALRDNTASYNANDGIDATSATVSGNTATSNGGNGISVSCPGSIVNNTAVNNPGGNLSLSGSGCALAANSAP